MGAGFEEVELLGLWDVVELGVLGELLSASGSVEGLGAEPSPARAGVIGRPSIPRGLNGASAGRFLDVSGWVGVLVGVELGYGFGGSWGLFPQSIPR